MASECTPVILASGGSLDLAIDGTNVYWTDGTNVKKCAIGGCAGVPTTLATGQADSADIAVDATSVYWINRGNGGPAAIQKCAIAGCGGAPTTLAGMQSSSNYGHNIAVVDGNVYWVTTPSAPYLMQCAVGGCGDAPTTLASLGAGTYGIAHDAANIYMATAVFDAATEADVGAVKACAIAGCGGTPTVVVSDVASDAILGVAVSGSSLYWIDSVPAVKTCTIGNCGSPTTLSSSAGGFALAVDPGAALYFTSGNILDECAIGGCGANPTPFAPGADELDGTYGIAVDATYVYWTGLEGVSKTPK